jgi:hypothetical protein
MRYWTVSSKSSLKGEPNERIYPSGVIKCFSSKTASFLSGKQGKRSGSSPSSTSTCKILNLKMEKEIIKVTSRH